MPFFCIHAFDHPDRQQDRLRLRPGHRDRLRQHDHPVAVRIGGPLLGEAGEMIGTMLVIEAKEKAQVESYLAGDPYVVEGLFKTISITGFNWGLGQPEEANG